MARGPGYALSLGPAAAVLTLGDSARLEEGLARNSAPSFARVFEQLGTFPKREAGRTPSRSDKDAREAKRSPSDLIRLEFVGANASAQAEGLDPLPGKSNYFTGNDPKAWRTNVPTFARVRYANVYPGVDLVYYGNPRELEYDLIVEPGGDVNVIKFSVSRGAGKDQGSLRITSGGDLAIPTAQGEVHLRKPVVYQEGPSETPQIGVGASRPFVIRNRTFVEGRYVLESAREVSFQVSGYDHRRPLVIDPTLEYSSFLGGSGWDNGVSTGVAVDAAGNLYIASGTNSANFPGTSGGFQGASAGCNLGGGQICGDVVVTKINSTGTAILYSAYLGGSGSDGAYGLAVDGSGHAYVTGPTDSTNFPTTSGAYQQHFGGDTAGCASTGFPPCGDAFVAKLDPSGSNLIYSTYLGGSADDYAEAVAIDSLGNAYVTGQTKSADYPTTLGAYQEASHAASCGTSLCGTVFVSKLNGSGSSLVYSTHVGGRLTSAAFAIAVDTAGEAYIAGAAAGTDFPTTPNAYQPSEPGGSDAVLVKLDATGSRLLYSTFLGGASSFDFAIGLAVDASGNAYVGGGTASFDFPVTAGAFQTSLSNWSTFHGFISKFDPTGFAASSLIFSSLLGGSVGDGVTAVMVDSAERIYLAGGTTSPDFPTVSPVQGLLAAGTGCGGLCGDGFVTVMNAAGSQLLFSTYLGGTGNEVLDALALDSAGIIYIGGGTTSTRYPTTAGALQPTFGGGGSDMFVAKIGPAPNTTTGTSVAVQPTSTVGVTFSQVTTAGTTAVTETTAGPAAPAGFVLGTPSVSYDISTTATFSGQASVCVSYAGVNFAGGIPTLFHHENNAWVDVTTSVDRPQQIVCGSVTSFSPFAVFGTVYSATVQAPISADGTSTFNARRGSIPVKFTLSVGGATTCTLVPATISLFRVTGANATAVNEDVYSLPSDSGSQFRIDKTTCQYVYNVNARTLGAGTYRVQISIFGSLIGSANFALQ